MKRWHFRLRSLFIATTIVAFSLAFGKLLLVVGALLVIGLGTMLLVVGQFGPGLFYLSPIFAIGAVVGIVVTRVVVLAGRYLDSRERQRV